MVFMKDVVFDFYHRWEMTGRDSVFQDYPNITYGK